MKHIYLINLEFCDGYDREYETKATTTLKKAKKILKDWATKEKQTTWINDYKIEELDNYEFSECYFDAQLNELRTTIWIKKQQIE